MGLIHLTEKPDFYARELFPSVLFKLAFALNHVLFKFSFCFEFKNEKGNHFFDKFCFDK